MIELKTYRAISKIHTSTIKSFVQQGMRRQIPEHIFDELINALKTLINNRDVDYVIRQQARLVRIQLYTHKQNALTIDHLNY